MSPASLQTDSTALSALCYPTWRNCAKTHINKIQIYQSKILRTFSNTLWFIKNETLHTDSKLPKINTYIRNLSTNFFDELKHANFNLSDKPTLRRLKRERLHDVLN